MSRLSLVRERAALTLYVRLKVPKGQYGASPHVVEVHVELVEVVEDVSLPCTLGGRGLRAVVHVKHHSPPCSSHAPRAPTCLGLRVLTLTIPTCAAVDVVVVVVVLIVEGVGVELAGLIKIG